MGTQSKNIEKQDDKKLEYTSEHRNLLVESARITRDSKHLYELRKMKVETFKALIIPSFSDDYNKTLVQDVQNVPEIRSVIKDFNIRGKYIFAVGPSAINLVGRVLDLQTLRPLPFIDQKDPFKFFVDEETKIITLPYDPKALNTAANLGLLNSSIWKAMISLKYRVANDTYGVKPQPTQEPKETPTPPSAEPQQEKTKDETPQEIAQSKAVNSKKEAPETKATPPKKGGIYKKPLEAPKAPGASNESEAAQISESDKRAQSPSKKAEAHKYEESPKKSDLPTNIEPQKKSESPTNADSPVKNSASNTDSKSLKKSKSPTKITASPLVSESPNSLSPPVFEPVKSESPAKSESPESPIKQSQADLEHKNETKTEKKVYKKRDQKKVQNK